MKNLLSFQVLFGTNVKEVRSKGVVACYPNHSTEELVLPNQGQKGCKVIQLNQHQPKTISFLFITMCLLFEFHRKFQYKYVLQYVTSMCK